MTPKKFFLYFLLQMVFLTVLKVWFFNNVIFANSGIQEIIFWILEGIIVAAIVRRLGVLTVFEALFTAVVWSIGNFLADLLLISGYFGVGFFFSQQYWRSYVVIALVIFFAHKKRHIHVRHSMHAATHGHAHAPEHGKEKKH